MKKYTFWIAFLFVFMFLPLCHANSIVKSKLIFHNLWGSNSMYVQVKTTPVNEHNKYKYDSKYLEVYFNKKLQYSLNVGLDNIVAGFPLSDESNVFITIWTGGSSYHIKIFKFHANKIELIADIGSKIFPEFVDINNDGKLDMVTSEEGYIVDAINNKTISEPNTATIWLQQEKGGFTSISHAWKDRFCK